MVSEIIANELTVGFDSQSPHQSEIVPTGTTQPARTDAGQFPKGVSGNPAGRPVGRKSEITALKQDLEVAVRRHVRPEKIKKILEKMVNKAANGNVQAAKLIFDHFLTKATDTDDAHDNSSGIRIVIENATFKAVQATQATQVVVTPVEGEFSEVEKK
jgi:hypothetical protein